MSPRERYEEARRAGAVIPPALYDAAQPEYTAMAHEAARLATETKLRRMDLDERGVALARMQAGPAWSPLGSIQQNQWIAWASSRQAPLPTMSPGLFLPRTLSRGAKASDLPADSHVLGGTERPTEGLWDLHQIPMTGDLFVTPARPATSIVQTLDGMGVVDRNSPANGVRPIAGAVPPSQNRPAVVTGPTGETSFQSPAGARAGTAPTPTGGINPSMLPTLSTNVTNIPGQPTEVRSTTRTKGIPARAPGATGPVRPRVDPIVRQAYDSWATGGPAPTGKKLNAVQAYQAANNLPDPVTLSAMGQNNLQAIDTVFLEIEDINRTLAKIAGNPSLAANYMKYKHLGIDAPAPYNDLFTKLSFEGLRSAAAALKGNNSRAYPIIQRAFEHVPNLDRLGGFLPDSIKLIKDKLSSMHDVLSDSRTTVLADERKSGVILPLKPGSTGTTKDPLGILK